MSRAPQALAILLFLSLFGCDRTAVNEPAEDAATPQGTQVPAGAGDARPASPAASSPAPAAAPAPAPATPAPVPPARQITVASLPAGTVLGVSLNTSLNSGTNQVGDKFTADVTQPISIDGRVVIPVGSQVHGSVDEVNAAKRGSGNGSLSLRFDMLQLPNGSTAQLSASLSDETGGKKKRNAAIIGGSAAGGAILGRVLGNDTKDAAIGAIVGGAIATGVVFSKKGAQVELPAGTELILQIDEAMELKIAEVS